MSKLVRFIAVVGASKLAASVLGRVRSSQTLPKPVKLCAAAALALLALKR